MEFKEIGLEKYLKKFNLRILEIKRCYSDLFKWAIKKWPRSEKLLEGIEYFIITIIDDKGNKSLAEGGMKRQNEQQGITNFIDPK